MFVFAVTLEVCVKKLNQFAARRATGLLAVLACSCLSGCATYASPPKLMAEEILPGTWEVDLRPTPSAEPYYQELVVTSVEGKAFSGTFYGSTISQARINTDWGKLRIAFTTVDGSGAYNHSATLEGKKLEGLSNATGRNFLSYWSAVKK